VHARLGEHVDVVGYRLQAGIGSAPLRIGEQQQGSDAGPAERDDELVLSWGDSRIGNMIWRDFRCVCITDFENVALAPRAFDLGFKSELAPILPVTIAPDTTAEYSDRGSNGQMEIVLAGGDRVIVWADVEMAALSRVLKALERR